MYYEWTGRDDGDGDDHLRIYKLIKPLPIIESNQLSKAAEIVLQHDHELPNIVLLGIETDEGVKRNRGRTGAVAGPNMIRNQLANIAIHFPFSLFDAGNLYCEGNDLEALQNKQIEIISTILQANYFPIILGGGHEIAYGNFMGLYQSTLLQLGSSSESKQRLNDPHRPKIGIINFDAHFDLRQQLTASSGTPFYQIAEKLEQQNAQFHYLCLGISENSNTRVLFKTADTLQVKYVYDHQLQLHNFEHVFTTIDKFTTQLDSLYITIDLDVFSYQTAPGVSAPSVLGIPRIVVERILTYLFHQFPSRVKLVDIAELNPNFDIDHHTSKLAAYLVTVLTKLRLKYNN